MVTPLIGVGGWPDYWRDLPVAARAPEFWASIGCNAVRLMFVNTASPFEVYAEAKQWLESGMHVRVAINWGRNPLMPDTVATIIEAQPKAVAEFAGRMATVAKMFEEIVPASQWSLEPCQETEIWQRWCGLDQARWPEAMKLWRRWVTTFHDLFRKVSKATLDIGSCANQEGAGFGDPYEHMQPSDLEGLVNVRSDAHMYAPKAVAFGRMQYPAAKCRVVKGQKLSEYDVAVTMMETCNRGPNLTGVRSAVATYEYHAMRLGLPIGFGEIGSQNRSHQLALLMTVQRFDRFVWDPRSMFKSGTLDLPMASALIGA